MVTNISMCRYLSERDPPPGRQWSLVLKVRQEEEEEEEEEEVSNRCC